jgi:hypothetical protein
MGQREMDALREDVRKLRAAVRMRPITTVRGGGGATVDPYRVISILGGNTSTIGNSIEGIVYASTVTPAAVYDPDVDTAYPDGLGYGILFEDGVDAGNVLVRHSFIGYPTPILAGDLVRVSGTGTITYDPGSGDVSMTVYLFDWV